MSPVVLRQGVQGLIQTRRRFAEKTRARFPDAMRLVKEIFPNDWDDVKECRTKYRVYRSKDRRDRYKVTPYACWRTPQCILCTVAGNHQRAVNALDRFARVTPAGRVPRFVHVVMTAPLTADGKGWGADASQNIPGFASVVRKSLAAIYDARLGGIMSYQDFGERGFAKRHPHMDLTLNGWHLAGAAMEPLPEVQLMGGGRGRVDGITARFASAFQLGAKPSNVHFSKVVEGVEQYYRVLRYQMREMIDLRKVAYDGTNIGWRSYRDPRRESMSVATFEARLRDYQARLGRTTTGKRVELHRAFGFMRKAELKRTQAKVGGRSVPHGRVCPCSNCEDWEREYAYGLDDEVGSERAGQGPRR